PILVMCTIGSAKFSTKRVATFAPKEPVTLHARLSGSIAPASDDLAEAFFARLSGRPSTLRVPDVQRALRRAGKDSRVKGLELTMHELSGSPADFTQLRRDLELFRNQGKHVKVLLHEPSDWHYYVGSVANELIIN